MGGVRSVWREMPNGEEVFSLEYHDDSSEDDNELEEAERLEARGLNNE